MVGGSGQDVTEKLAVIGLGYVGLPVAVAFAGRGFDVVGFDVSTRRIEELRAGRDATREVTADALAACDIRFTSDPEDLTGRTAFIVCVPTPIDAERRPDFGPLLSACRTIAPRLLEGAVVIFESTVFPGATRDVCRPVLEAGAEIDPSAFRIAYSPERINPGDKTHTIETIVKVVSGEDEATLRRVASLYEAVVTAGVHRATSIEAAEAAKVIENTQRDINIALMNELSIIFERLGLRTKDVLEAAGTKWNFLKFTPGLVGGHCIGVDPYYLTSKAEAVGHHPEVILAGRRINDSMGRFVAGKTVKLMIESNVSVKGARVGVFGLTFKENVPDLRNSKVADVIAELREFGIEPLVHDPLAEPDQAFAEYGVTMAGIDDMRDLDALVLAVNHRAYIETPQALFARLRTGGVLVDVKSALSPGDVRDDLRYWSL